MRIIQAIYVGFLSSLVFLSCGKKKNEPQAQQGSNSNVAVIPGGPPADFSNCYGEVYFYESINIGKGEPGLTRFAPEARFYDKPITNSLKTSVDAGAVFINGKQLKQYGGISTHRVYIDTTNTLFSLLDFTLAATGTNTQSQVNFQYKVNEPLQLDTTKVPSIVKRLEGIDIELSGISGADSLIFSVERSFSQSLILPIYAFNKNKVEIKVTSTDLNTLMGNYIEATTRITIFRKILVKAGSKDYMVHSKKVYTKALLVSHL